MDLPDWKAAQLHTCILKRKDVVQRQRRAERVETYFLAAGISPITVLRIGIDTFRHHAQFWRMGWVDGRVDDTRAFCATSSCGQPGPDPPGSQSCKNWRPCPVHCISQRSSLQLEWDDCT